ncbi:MAG: AAA family ATPase [Saprospiraceae bacterium]
MSKIRIKNFGPIKEGFQENDGWMEVKKVTVFIGNQGSGKSTVAKVISTLSWLEKALNRGDSIWIHNRLDFQNYFEYQGLKGYFKKDTIIEYHGNSCSILYSLDELENNPDKKTLNYTPSIYIVPKIMYVPAERNFLTVIKNATGVRGLPPPLFEFAEELKRGQFESKGKEIPLPINDVYYKYDEESDSSFIIGKDFNINLLVASSGFQSLVPLFLVSLSLGLIVKNGSEITPDNISVDQSIRMNAQISKIMSNNAFNDEEKIQKANEIRAKFQNKAFINIVEEPEQNLFPSSQRQILNSLLEFNNMSEGNKLIMTTHSPYIINYLNIAIQGAYLMDKIKDSTNREALTEKLNKIVPADAVVSVKDTVIYQLDETLGTITRLPAPEGIPSDKNYLNQSIAEGNRLFDALLEIEEEL